ncbi:MAG: adaptor protein MecA [Lachnospiraceae bacterium]|nr:adaptor protein MecA [Lachnospiraceae bacterium]
MKIEKVNERQIRCTLTREDLADRELKISELAYGTEKAKTLFRDMMQQASFEFGFEAEDIPLMIEAIPLNSECIVLIITKVDDPEELDTRFSKFAPSVHDKDEDADDDYNDDITDEDSDSTEDVMDLFKRLKENPSFSEAIEQAQNNMQERKAAAKKNPVDIEDSHSLCRMFSFNSMRDLLRLSAVIKSGNVGSNTLYKDTSANRYILLIAKDTMSTEQFNKLCNNLSEYGHPEHQVPAGTAYLEEHFTPVITDDALQQLMQLA